MNERFVTPPRGEVCHPEAIPEALITRPHWVGWHRIARDGTLTKVPKDPTTGQLAKTTDPRTWSTFPLTLEATRRFGWDGVGIVFAGDGLFGIDLDHCRNPVSGEISDEAQAILTRFPGSFAEVSPSGRGIHLIGQAQALPHPSSGNKRDGLEVYWHSRFFTVTGNPLPAHQTLSADHTETLRQWHAEVFAPPPTRRLEAPRQVETDTLLARCLQHPAFRALHEWGDTSHYHHDDSAADLAYVTIIVNLGGTLEQADALYRQSAIARPKWDARRGQQTYGERTLHRATQNRNRR